IVKEQIWDLKIVDNQLFVATSEGIYKTSNGSDFLRVSNQSANVLIYHPRRNDFIVAGAHGVYVYDKSFREKWAYNNNFPTFIGGEIDPENDSIIWLGSSKTEAVQLMETKVG